METEKITVKVDGKDYIYDKGTTLLEMSRGFAKNYTTPIVAATINNNIKDMSTSVIKDCEVGFLDLTTEAGFKVYSRSLVFVMVMAAKDIFPDGQIIVQHSMSKGLYCEFNLDYPLTENDVKAVEDRMREIVGENLPITKKTLPLKEAIDLFKAVGLNAKAKLMGQMGREKADVYFCDESYSYLYFTMVPSTGYLKKFELRYYEPGMILRYPTQEHPDKLPQFVEMPKLAKVFLEAKRWAEIVECDYISRLNEYVLSGGINNVILMAEALHEKKIAEIADHIESNINRLKMILVAGPSSSGKTTFIQRLSVQLRVLGIRTIKISLDDYYMDREKMYSLKNEVDLESLDVIDVELFDEHLKSIMAGEEIELPHFEFKTGRQIPSGRKVQIGRRKIIIVEGLHALNERLTESVPRHNKTKIHISPMTHLAVDEHSRVQTTDTRLIRRIVRDSQFRNYDARQTLKMWPSVMRGEQKNIFPYTEDADIMFNSALLYEMAVLRNFAIPLLQEIGPEHPEHREARRLIRYLSFVFPVTDAEIPLNSILREFVGKSCFFR